MVIEKTTAAERECIEDNMLGIMSSLNDVYHVLHDLWEQYFGAADQKEIDAWTATVMGSTLRMCLDSVWHCLLEYALMTGNKDFRGVRPHLESAKREAAVFRANELLSILETNVRAGSNTQNAAVQFTKQHLKDLPDEQLISILESQLNKA